jgi:hypothetical protein
MASSKPVRWPIDIIRHSAPSFNVVISHPAKAPALAESKAEPDVILTTSN